MSEREQFLKVQGCTHCSLLETGCLQVSILGRNARLVFSGGYLIPCIQLGADRLEDCQKDKTLVQNLEATLTSILSVANPKQKTPV